MKLYWNYHGRISRKEFWLGLVCIILVEFIISISLAIFLSPFIDSGNHSIVLGTILCLVFFWPNLCLQTKRFHDCGMSGWWILLNIIPYFGIIFTTIILGFIKGSVGPNNHGADPVQFPSNNSSVYSAEVSANELYKQGFGEFSS